MLITSLSMQNSNQLVCNSLAVEMSLRLKKMLFITWLHALVKNSMAWNVILARLFAYVWSLNLLV